VAVWLWACDWLVWTWTFAICRFARQSAKIGFVLEEAGGTMRAADLIATVEELGTHYLSPQPRVLPWYRVYLVDVYAALCTLLCGIGLSVRFCWFVCAGLLPDEHVGTEKEKHKHA
jgi:hypothetical protein